MVLEGEGYAVVRGGQRERRWPRLPDVAPDLILSTCNCQHLRPGSCWSPLKRAKGDEASRASSFPTLVSS